ncbi:PIG-L family deacetylase [Sediminicola luteus]|uniref:LmbE family protein n=1 Tax=Sediminicola luteus TaxID=319238 RepID=A0A2A4G8N0_9FLAO|nr:PIG-L family deacetylase [Sediminicola luteus]PCE64122.1 LmbE family protein [Sediminicola luteus]
MRNIALWLFLAIAGMAPSWAQAPKPLSATEIHHELQKLNFLGTALYVAAHPDDENTRLISYLDNAVKANTVYLSLTRGDGGQNLIGTELRELLGVLRTQELLAARSVDGGEQRFSRANDFGYSKHPDETLKIWDKDLVLSDVVRTIRLLKPDIIINRFDHRTPGTTHGHHTSSAMLSVEAFDLANDPISYPEQLTALDTWQPKRMFFNTSWWFYGSQENFAKADKTNLMQVDIGTYYPELGLSNNEIASVASSQHLCQGFGRVTTRGSQDEWVELIKGDLPQDKTDLFDGIDTSWKRVKGGAAIGKILKAVETDFNYADPSTHLPQLMEAYSLIQGLEDAHWKARKTAEIEKIIEACAGLFLEARTDQAAIAPGETGKVSLEMLNRSGVPLTIKEIEIIPDGYQEYPNITLKNNKKETRDMEFKVPTDATYTAPYWLLEDIGLGMYTVSNTELIGLPETPRKFFVRFDLEIAGIPISIAKPMVYRYALPEKGEIYEPFQILPPATASIANKVMLFADGKPHEIPVTVNAGKNNLSGSLRLKLGAGWQSTPASLPINIERKGDQKTYSFTLTPPSNQSELWISPQLEVNGKTYDQELIPIDYAHIPKQSVLLPSKAKAVRLNIKKSGERIGYIMGAGDDVLTSLEQIGYTVDLLDIASLNSEQLQAYDAVVLGIRAYNVHKDLAFKKELLMDYVAQGGNLVVQYNTVSRRAAALKDFAPYPLQLSRDRVTDETAQVRILDAKHPLLNYPNKISAADFEGWVQERGLYFPNEWSAEYTPLLGMKDAGETEKTGSLLVAEYGKGQYIYTGLSFFRELPAGVAGAYKLFANLIATRPTQNQ